MLAQACAQFWLVNPFTQKSATVGANVGTNVGKNVGVTVGLDGAAVGVTVGLDGAAVGATVGFDGAAVGVVVGADVEAKYALNFAKFIEPKPVTGSHPGAVSKPRGHWPILLLPTVISFVKAPSLAYNAGFRKPREGLPTSLR